MGTTLGVPDRTIKVWTALGTAALVVVGAVGFAGTLELGYALLVAVGVVGGGLLLALTVFETAGRSVVTTVRDEGSTTGLAVGDLLEVTFALVFFAGVGSLPFALRTVGDPAAVVPPLSASLLVVGLLGMIATVLVRVGLGRLGARNETEEP